MSQRSGTDFERLRTLVDDFLTSGLGYNSALAQPQRPRALEQCRWTLGHSLLEKEREAKTKGFKGKYKNQQLDVQSGKGETDKGAQPESQARFSTCGVWGQSSKTTQCHSSLGTQPRQLAIVNGGMLPEYGDVFCASVENERLSELWRCPLQGVMWKIPSSC